MNYSEIIYSILSKVFPESSLDYTHKKCNNNLVLISVKLYSITKKQLNLLVSNILK